jgi:hypothetical protein
VSQGVSLVRLSSVSGQNGAEFHIKPLAAGASPRGRPGGDPIVQSALAAHAVVIPLGLGGAVSPAMFTGQTVLLAGPAGGKTAIGYAAGVVLIRDGRRHCAVGRAISLPTGRAAKSVEVGRKLG